MDKKILVAMSHKLTKDQVDDLIQMGYEPIFSDNYIRLKMNQLDPELEANQVQQLANLLVFEAKNKRCSAIVMVGEPALTFYVWKEALETGLRVLQSTTKRILLEEVQEDGTVRKTQIFKHVQWREIE